MDYQSQKQDKTKIAEMTIAQINASKDPYVVYKTSRPITDLKNMIETSAKLYENNVAFRQRFIKGEPFREITYKMALVDINSLGTMLIHEGLKNKRIAVIGDNSYEWAISYLAVVCGTGVVVPLDKELGTNELKQLIIESEAEAVIFTNKYQSVFQDIKNSGETKLQVLVNMNISDNIIDANSKNGDKILSLTKMIEEGKNLIAMGDRNFLDADIDPEAMSIILFTSGTTGIAKGVMLSHRNICENLMVAPTILNVNTDDIFFSVLPIHHTYECTCGFLMPLYKGASIAYCEGLKYLLKNLQEVKPTMFLAVPLIFENIYKNIIKTIRKQNKENTVKKVMNLNKFTSKFGIDLNKKFLKEILNVFGGNMRVLISGGAAIDPSVLQFFNDLGMVAVQGYGLTECSPMVALNPDTHKTMRNKSVGHLLPMMEVKIDGKGEDGIGEICFKGANVMMGYYNMPDETKKVLKDGWFHTGDLGYVDESNFIYITGRQKNVIITRNGKNVFPEELEYYLGKVPYISESMVWAKQDADGQDAVITATIKPDMEEVVAQLGEENAKNDAEIEKLIWAEVDKINDDLPLFKKIKKITIRHEEFEKTTGKKIKRFVESNKKA